MIKEIIKLLYKRFPEATTALKHSSALDLLIATILSAQCTDERVNKVTEGLFKRFKRPADYIKAGRQKLEEQIRSINFYKNKAKNIIELCKILDKKYNGKVPADMEKLMMLPGVARKTANLVMGSWFGIPTGIVVDTHVKRVAQRLRLTAHDDPVKIEEDLKKIVRKEEWVRFSHTLILFGRHICRAKNPSCDTCPITRYCPSFVKVKT